MILRILSIGISVAVLCGMMWFIGTQGSFTNGIVFWLVGMLFMLPFYGFPPVVSIVLSACSKTSISQIIATMVTCLYGVWFAYAMNDAFYVHVDAQSALIIIFVGIYALPVLLPLWIIAYFVDRRSRKKDQPTEIQNRPAELRPGYGFAITSLTLGLLCVGTLGLVLSIIGIVFGILSLKTQGRKVGIAGLVLCIIMTIFHVLDTLLPVFGGG